MRLLIHAPNIHAGGGLKLLYTLLSLAPLPIDWLQLDDRIKKEKLTLINKRVFFVRNKVAFRFFAECRLWFHSRPDDIILCFHGLPPLFSLRGRVIVFVQNKLLITRSSLTNYSLWTRTRITIERIWFKLFRRQKIRYIVQTNSMAIELKKILNDLTNIDIIPFVPERKINKQQEADFSVKKFDFVYVASGESHKNHKNLLEAWCYLAESGYKPSLALTLDQSVDSTLCQQMNNLITKNNLSVYMLGVLNNEGINQLYKIAAALIYPSMTESFGLPLIEASNYGLPILASELDYVRDIVMPVQTFDPTSPISIARAVMRFLDIPMLYQKNRTALEFLEEIIK